MITTAGNGPGPAGVLNCPLAPTYAGIRAGSAGWIACPHAATARMMPSATLPPTRAERVATLAFDGAGREAGDVVLHEERIDEGNRHRAQQRAGHQLPPVEGVAPDELAHDADRDGPDVGAAEEEQRVQELVLRQGESEDAGGDEAGHAEGQD